jgi:hypothetical protein
MSNPTIDGVFPLPLGGFEQFMLEADSPRYPSMFLSRWTFSGTLDRQALEESLGEVGRRHPLLHAVVRRDRREGLRFEYREEARPRLSWGPPDAPLDLPEQGERIRPGVEPGVRVWVRHDDSKAVLTLAFHHSFVDGMGAARFIGDLMAFYAARMGQGANGAVLGALSPNRLAHREYHMKFGPGGEAQPLSGPAMLNWTARLFGTTAAFLASPTKTDGRTKLSAFPGMYTVQLDQQQRERLRQGARAHGVFTNDLFLAAMFLTLYRWNRRHGARMLDAPLRVALPLDMRGRDDDALPAANVVSIAFLDRLAKQCRSRRDLLAGVRTDTIRIRNSNVGSEFIQILGLTEMMKGWLGVLVRGTRCLATAVLSNTGDVTRRLSTIFPKRDGKLVVGNLVLEDQTGVAPLWRGTRAAFGLTTYAGGTTISLRCDPWRFTPAATEELLQEYVAALLDIAAKAP